MTPSGVPLAARDAQSGQIRTPAGVRSPADDRVYVCRPTPGSPVVAAAVDELPILAVRHDANNCGAIISEYPTVIP